jgi:epoxyqueuosine reductase
MADTRLADELIRVGRGAGLDAIGLCDASRFEDTRRVLIDRRSRGWAAGMQFTYRRPERSTDPQATLPGAAALVVGARRYERAEPERQEREARDDPDPGNEREVPGDPDGPHWRQGRITLGGETARATGAGPPDGPRRAPFAGSPDGRPRAAIAGSPDERPRARVAMYSWIDHYRLLRDALGAVADHLVRAGWQARVVADDNALVDRAAAVRAGLGWYGKNENVLLPGAGSWFVLGSVITDAPLTAGRPAPLPVADGCRSCQRCLTACPTGALVGPGQLDARRCLAWLVQAPGVFPREYREALGDRLYGCDDCQTSCPVNRVATHRHPPPAAELGAQPTVDLLWLLSADDDQLMTALGRWYIPGRQPRYLRRNALVVLGNTGDPGDPAVIDAVTRALADGDSIVRAHAVWAANRLGRPDLLGRLKDDHDPLVAAELAAIKSAVR